MKKKKTQKSKRSSSSPIYEREREREIHPLQFQIVKMVNIAAHWKLKSLFRYLLGFFSPVFFQLTGTFLCVSLLFCGSSYCSRLTMYSIKIKNPRKKKKMKRKLLSNAYSELFNHAEKENRKFLITKFIRQLIYIK